MMNMDNHIKALELLSKDEGQRKHLLKLLDSEISLPNVKFPTMGGHVFWTDIAEYNGWRLQQNSITRHARILDNNDIRIAWGTVNGMYRALDRLVESSHRYDSIGPSSEERIEYMEELKKLKELLDTGAITEAEFNDKKEKIMKKI